MRKNGKTIKCKIPKRNNKVPKKKRMRKKRFWFFCGDCNRWFKRYEATWATGTNGKKVCHPCIIKRLDHSKEKKKGESIKLKIS
jgi:hypothetical protein